MSSGISTQGGRGLSATGAVRTVRTCAVLGRSGTPMKLMNTGIIRATSIATAHGPSPAPLFAIVQNDVRAMANVCRTCVAKPNFRASVEVRRTWGMEMPRITLHGDRDESGH